ncbi:cell division protein ZipA [uncultured Umboniibacter sp.]|uniref:cell division protein ZipA n=1 Tax=uncultured Umboniibacter sp. TaxID=1798917 RepID=UPI00261F1BA6|nr:cell division protein ZipA [uncultured Umboniibacter sp.]
MELNLQNISILVGVLILLVLALDGLRRSIRARRSEIRMNLNLKDGLDKDVLEELSHELPRGGARVVNRNGETIDAYAEGDTEVSADESVDPIYDETTKREPSFGVTPNQVEFDFPEVKEAATTHVASGNEDFDLNEVPTLTESVEEPAPAPLVSQEPGHNLEPGDEVLTIFVRARKGTQFGGHEVVEALLRSGVNYGSKKIFHAHFDDKLKNEVSFSVANMVEPGYFDIEALSEFSTTGLIFFMSLPKQNPHIALRTMVDAARSTSTALDGEVFDSDLSVFTQQTLTHYENRLHEFTRTQMRKQRESTAE